MVEDYKQPEMGLIAGGIAGLTISALVTIYCGSNYFSYASEHSRLLANSSRVNTYSKKEVLSYNQRMIETTTKANNHAVFSTIGLIGLLASGTVTKVGFAKRNNRLIQERKTQRFNHPRKM